MRETLEVWLDVGWIRAVDLQFAHHLCELTECSNEQRSELMLLLTLLSHQVGRGHVCIDLNTLIAHPNRTLALPPQDRRYPQHLRDRLKQAEKQSPAQLLQHLSAATIQETLEQTGVAGDGAEVTPLVLQQGRLYMRRYWLYERKIASAVTARLPLRPGLNDPNSPESRQLERTLDKLFGPHSSTDYQRAACALAARSRFSLITGGPGTGKTTTVIKLLALLQSMATPDTEAHTRKYRIELAAPTGKAAARLNESIRNAIDQLPFSAFEGELTPTDLPTKVRTLHRLLGSRRYSREFRHNADNPLAVDILVIDEASMIDVSMLAAVVSALPDHSQLILLGDQDQLASVEAGSVLGELCARSREGHYQPHTLNWLAQAAKVQLPLALQDKRGTALDQSIAMLRHSYRFDASSGIGQLAQAINLGNGLQATINACQQNHYSDVSFVTPSGQTKEGRNERLLKQLEQHASEGYRDYLARANDADLSETARDSSAAAILNAYAGFQLLTPVRQGEFGVNELNLRVARQLHSLGIIDNQQEWYHGRPIMVSANDYNLGLMNGDIGICLHIEGRPLIAFMPDDADGSIRWIPPSRLPAHETVFAMTVHKSQGSEFEHCALVLPVQDSPVLTRELIYTAVTRSRSHFSLISENPQSVIQITQRSTERVSGLGSFLFGGAEDNLDDRSKQASSPAPESTLFGDGQLDLF